MTIFFFQIYGNSNKNLVLIGGNSVCKYEDDGAHMIKKSGWSEYINYYIDEKTNIINLSERGQTLETFINSEISNNCFKTLNKEDIIILQLEREDFNSDSLKDNLSSIVSIIKNIGCDLYVIFPYLPNLNDENKSDIVEISNFLEENKINVSEVMYLGYIYSDDGKSILSYYKDKKLGYDYDGLNCIFADMVAGHIVNKVFEKENYFPDPSYSVTRGMFVSQLVKMSGCKIFAEEAFIDVNKDNEYYYEIATAKAMGIINGYSDGSFHPDEEISLDDACVIAVKLLRKLNEKYSISFFNVGNDVEIKQKMVEKYSEETGLEKYAVPYAFDLSMYGAITVWNIKDLPKNIAILDIYQLFYDEIYL